MYLTKRKPVPRTGDLQRYAYSALMILRNDKSQTTLDLDIIDFVNDLEENKN